MASHTLITSLFNLDSSRACHPSLHKRQKGFTESWGTEDHTNNPSNNNKEHRASPKVLILTQHKIAHLEQLYLRIFHIPHIVQNSSYICTESTGPLPYLMDLSLSSSSSSTQDTKNDDHDNRPPALIGRHHPHHDPTITTTISQSSSCHPFLSPNSNPNSSEQYTKNGSDILTYLQISHHDATLQTSTTNDTNKNNDPTMTLYHSLIEETLQPILEYKRYCWTNHHDSFQKDAYYKLFMNAGTTSPISKHIDSNQDVDPSPSLYATNLFLHPFTAFQYWCTKTLSYSHLQYWNQNRSSSSSNTTSYSTNPFSWSSSSKDSNTDSPLHLFQKVKEGYQCLEDYFMTHPFQSESTSTSTFIPTLLEIRLYAHLCDAILDPEFLMILSLHPHVFQWFQSIHTYYFGPEYGKRHGNQEGKQELDWIAYNNEMNAHNAFHPNHFVSKLDSSSTTATTMTMLEYIQTQLETHFQSETQNDATTETMDNHDGTNKNETDPQILQRMEQIQTILQLFSIHHSKNHSHPANAFHRVRLGGSLHENSNTTNSQSTSSIWKDLFQSPDDDTSESFDGYLSSNYLKNQTRWYSKYIQRYSRRNKEDTDNKDAQTAHGGDSNAGTSSSTSGSNTGDHWMKMQKKLAMEQDQKWMGFVVGIAAVVFLATATGNE